MSLARFLDGMIGKSSFRNDAIVFFSFLPSPCQTARFFSYILEHACIERFFIPFRLHEEHGVLFFIQPHQIYFVASSYAFASNAVRRPPCREKSVSKFPLFTRLACGKMKLK